MDVETTIESAQFREAMSRFGASVHVITTEGPAGRCGITASAVCSVTDRPPTMLVCLNRDSQMNSAFRENRVFCVNTLPASAQALSDAFAGRDQLEMADRFALAQWQNMNTGAPALLEARVSVDCRVNQISEVGTHSVLFGEVIDVRIGEPGPALMYLDRAYRVL